MALLLTSSSFNASLWSSLNNFICKKISKGLAEIIDKKVVWLLLFFLALTQGYI